MLSSSQMLMLNYILVHFISSDVTVTSVSLAVQLKVRVLISSQDNRQISFHLILRNCENLVLIRRASFRRSIKIR